MKRLLLIFFCISLGLLAGPKDNISNPWDTTNIEKEIKVLHANLAKIFSSNDIDGIKNNQYSTDINMGYHNFFSDREKYVYRQRAVCYFSGLKLQKIVFLYQQSDTTRYFTEVRRIEVNNIGGKTMGSMQIIYVSWTLDEDLTNKAVNRQLLPLDPKQAFPPAAEIKIYHLESLKPRQRYSTLREYRKMLNKLGRMIEYRMQHKEYQKNIQVNHSLKIGKNN